MLVSIVLTYLAIAYSVARVNYDSVEKYIPGSVVFIRAVFWPIYVILFLLYAIPVLLVAFVRFIIGGILTELKELKAIWQDFQNDMGEF